MSVSPLTDSLLIVDHENSKINAETTMESQPPKMNSMHVVSNIRNRYARTVVTSMYTNQDTRAQQATFSIVLPDTAFIAGFVMEIKGKKYEAYVKEKEEAKQKYQEAVSRGQAAAHVAVSARDSNNFSVSVNVEPQSDVTFILTYEELLVRKHSKYEMLINLHPGHALDDLQVDVHINETRPIINVETPALRSGNEITDKISKDEYVTINKENDRVVHISFHPSVEQQKAMAKALAEKKEENETSKEVPDESKDNGFSGQFVIEYDVERDPLGGEVLVNEGYFVHFFAPTDLKPIPKHVIFVLDVSGSMGGRKLKQLKEAMKIILSELNPGDYFNLVKFSDSVSVLNSNYSWNNIEIPAESKLPESFGVNAKNIKLVQNIVDQIAHGGGTNIYDALIVGLRLTSKGITHLRETAKKHKPQPIVMFLTDGQPNITESNPRKIIEMVEDRNDCDNKSAVFTLAFGDNADKEFLKELAIQNFGFLRNIYEAADASLQLQDFYKQISSPLLTNVNFKYSNVIKDVTKHNFDILFNGSEFVVAGKVDEMVDDFVFVEGLTLHGKNEFCPSVVTIFPEDKGEYGSLERLWAYMTIKQLLDKKYEKTASASDGNQFEKNTTEEETLEKQSDKKEKAEKQALELALKYSFVTPVTSLIVVKPDLPADEQLQNSSVLKNGMRLELEDISTNLSYPMHEKVENTFRKKRIMIRKCKKRSFPTILSVEPENIWENIMLKSITFDCKVKNHIATTQERRKYFNFGNIPKEATFTIVLPDKTIFTELIIESEGQVIRAVGRNEEQAKEDFQQAVSNNEEAVLVNLQDSDKITILLRIMPQREVTFSLLYATTPETKNNKHKIVLNLEREASTEEMSANVHLTESTAIENVDTPPLQSQNKFMKNEYAKINNINDNEVHVELSPTVQQQEEINAILAGADGHFSGQFIVEYEVKSKSAALLNSVTDGPVAVQFPYLFAVLKNNK